MSGTSPVALAIATISTIVFEPSTNSTSMRGFMLPPRRLVDVVVGRRVDVERIVLALAGGDDRIAQAATKLIELHAVELRLVAGAERVDDAQPVGLALQVGADGDVGLDVHHHEVLAVLHGARARSRRRRPDCRWRR